MREQEPGAIAWNVGASKPRRHPSLLALGAGWECRGTRSLIVCYTALKHGLHALLKRGIPDRINRRKAVAKFLITELLSVPFVMCDSVKLARALKVFNRDAPFSVVGEERFHGFAVGGKRGGQFGFSWHAAIITPVPKTPKKGVSKYQPPENNRSTAFLAGRFHQKQAKNREIDAKAIFSPIGAFLMILARQVWKNFFRLNCPTFRRPTALILGNALPYPLPYSC